MMNEGTGFGAVAGTNIFLAFTFIFEPGKWFMTDASFGRAILAYGYAGLLFAAACAALGTLVARSMK